MGEGLPATTGGAQASARPQLLGSTTTSPPGWAKHRPLAGVRDEIRRGSDRRGVVPAVDLHARPAGACATFAGLRGPADEYEHVIAAARAAYGKILAEVVSGREHRAANAGATLAHPRDRATALERPDRPERLDVCTLRARVIVARRVPQRRPQPPGRARAAARSARRRRSPESARRGAGNAPEGGCPRR